MGSLVEKRCWLYAEYTPDGDLIVALDQILTFSDSGSQKIRGDQVKQPASAWRSNRTRLSRSPEHDLY